MQSAGRLSDKEKKKKLFLVCLGLCRGTGLKDMERGVGTWATREMLLIFSSKTRLETELVTGH